jgi:hypothetical protein
MCFDLSGWKELPAVVQLHHSKIGHTTSGVGQSRSLKRSAPCLLLPDGDHKADISAGQIDANGRNALARIPLCCLYLIVTLTLTFMVALRAPLCSRIDKVNES